MAGKQKLSKMLDAAMPAVEAAQCVLAYRLEAVEQRLDPAVERPHEDVEHIHRLRVTSRRAGASLRAFKPCFPRKRLKAAGRGIRSLRRAAGSARTCDVQIETLREWHHEADGPHRTVLEDLLRRLERERALAQRELVAAGRKHPTNSLRKARRRLLETARAPQIEGNDEPTLRDLAAVSLPPLLDSFNEAWRADMSSVRNIHALRIRGKRVRYALELFACCMDPAQYRSDSAQVRSLQEQLGEINDWHELTERLARIVCVEKAETARAHPWTSAAHELLQSCARRFDERVEGFRADWVPGDRAPLQVLVTGL